MSLPIRILAGPRARARLCDEGLQPQQVRLIPGAAGGPKWLILKALDRFLFGSWLQDAHQPIDLVGASIGAWRFTAAAGGDPTACIDHFEAAYLGQRYSDQPDSDEISREVSRVFHAFVTDDLVDQVLNNSRFRLHILVNRCRGLTASERRGPLTAGLGFAAVANIISRRSLHLSFQRYVYHHADSSTDYLQKSPYRAKCHPLNKANFRPALEATGAIPLVMHGVRNIPGSPKGMYRDGGIIDYHLDLPFMKNREPGIVLYPHFFDRLVPGWFDKRLPYRRPKVDHLNDLVMISPSPALLADLPLGKISDRTDFKRFLGRDDDRIAYWRQVLAAGERMAAGLEELLEQNRIADLVEPFPIQ